MKKTIFILLCVVLSFCLFGCADNSIKFNRKSSFSEFMQDVQGQPKVKKSSGVMIYRDEQKPQGNRSQNTGSGGAFGPSDVNFNMQFK